MLHAAALWALWKYRNDMCFNRVLWSGMQAIWRKTTSTLSAWEVLCSGPARESGDSGEAGTAIERPSAAAVARPRLALSLCASIGATFL